MEAGILPIVMGIWLVLAVGVFFAGLVETAPYGRHRPAALGVGLPDATAWAIIEMPAAVVFLLFFVIGSHSCNAESIAFLAMWEAHYADRAVIYPFRRRSIGHPMPLAIVLTGVIFNATNSFFNSGYLFTWAPAYPGRWVTDPRFLIGLVLFVAGFIMNRMADRALAVLRDAGHSGYRIPHGGMFRWISCPNYLGEIIEWIGWAVATWSPPGLCFAVWTAAILVPRARSHDLWYRGHFPNYPSDRKALIPGLW